VEQSKGHLEVRGLTLRLDGRLILRDVNIDFWPGHVHALIGPNGAGKSTLANAIMGLSGYREFDGDILLDGQSLKQVSIDQRARRGITLAWQEPARYEGLPVTEFVLAGVTDRSPGIVERVLSQVGLNPQQYVSRKVDKTLSGGERKRLELASILAMQPQIVLMDEPDSGIDVEALGRILQAVQDLKARGATVVLITHSLTVLEAAEHAFLFCCGRLVDKGSVERIRKYFENNCIPCDHRDAREVAPATSGG
jgi:Fe-S cluster assembly ATP-binding protein